MEQPYNVIIEDEAKSDIRGILEYYDYSLQIPSVGLKIVASIHRRINEVSFTPEGPPIYELSNFSYTIRVAHERKYKYNIYYITDKDNRTIRILRIFHARQNQTLN